METATKLFGMSPITHSFFLETEGQNREGTEEGKRERKMNIRVYWNRW